jgi:hypothetical protein
MYMVIDLLADWRSTLRHQRPFRIIPKASHVALAYPPTMVTSPFHDTVARPQITFFFEESNLESR